MKNKETIIKSNTIYSPQAYLEIVTGNCYGFLMEVPILKQIENVLKHYNLPIKSYTLKETETALRQRKPMILVDCRDVDDNSNIITEYRWFNVPNDFKEI